MCLCGRVSVCTSLRGCVCVGVRSCGCVDMCVRVEQIIVEFVQLYKSVNGHWTVVDTCKRILLAK